MRTRERPPQGGCFFARRTAAGVILPGRSPRVFPVALPWKICYTVTVCILEGKRHADPGHRPRLRHHRLRPHHGGAGTSEHAYLRRHHHPGGAAALPAAVPDRHRYGGPDRPAEAGCHLHRGAVLQHEPDHRHRRGPRPRRAAVHGGKVRDPAPRVHPLPGEDGGGGLRQGGKAPGDGHDPPRTPWPWPCAMPGGPRPACPCRTAGSRRPSEQSGTGPLRRTPEFRTPKKV